MLRNKIKNIILNDNNKLRHFCCKKEWYEKNNYEEIYNLIFSETSFLDSDSSLRERIFYIEKDLFETEKCLCGKKIKFVYTGSPKFLKSCGEKQCVNNVLSQEVKNVWDNRNFETKVEIKNKISFKLKDRKLSKEHCEKISNFLTGKKQDKNLIEKRFRSRKNNGKPWHTDETKIKLSVSNKITHLSLEYKNKTKEKYQSARKKISDSIKKRILAGEFTPPITNSWTHWESYILQNDQKKKFRSSWEALFWLLKDNIEYEKIRIPYTYKEESRIYIIDFVSHKEKKIFEIKPSNLILEEKNKKKFESAEVWCKENNYFLEIIDEKWFKTNFDKDKLVGNEHLYEKIRNIIC